MNRWTVVGVGASVAMLLGGCSSGSTAPSSSSTSPSISTPTANPTDVMADEAIIAYHRAREVVNSMMESPKATLGEYPASLHITDVLTGEALTLAEKSGRDLVEAKWSMRTQMGGSAPRVLSVDQSKGVVVLSHCAMDETTTISSNGQSGAVVPGAGQAERPYRSTYTFIRQSGVWKLSTYATDDKRTCATD